MDKDVARHVVRAAFQSGRGLSELLGLLKANCGAAEYEAYSRGIAGAMASIQQEVIDRVLSNHPELKAEIEQSIAKYDRYL
jgi:hypothetical protein